MRETRCFAYFALCVVAAHILPAKTVNEDVFERLERCNVLWSEAGASSLDSMPTGNGDIALNVWGDENGDIFFYIGKTDAWSEDVKGEEGLLKLGLVKISLSPNPHKEKQAAFAQTLKLKESEVIIRHGPKGAETHTRIWVDANNPSVNVDIVSDKALSAKAELINWRDSKKGTISADIIFGAKNGKLSWCHHNKSREPALNMLAFGAVMEGDNFKAESPALLASKNANKKHRISLYAFTGKFESPEDWQEFAFRQAASIAAKDYGKRLREHALWWENFWTRSWIFIEGSKEADDITLGYNLQRYMTACAGRGAYPIKFNGSLFVTDRKAHNTDNPKDPRPRTADYRRWGGQYWFQNTRPMYWARLKAGDFDLMEPLFKMYFNMLERNRADIEKFYGHGGFYFAETTPFYGGLDNVGGRDAPENWTAHYYLPVLELSMMMLDYAEYTQDAKFIKDTAMPMFLGAVEFYSKHFGRDEKGKLLIEPCNSIEQFWKAKNPAPDIAAFNAIIARVLNYDGSIVSPPQKTGLKKFLGILPPMPEGERNGRNVILPYEGPQTMKPRNSENPELYAIYPFRIYGLGKPELQKAIDSFNARRFRFKGCWAQDPVQAAYLGLDSVAKEYVLACFRSKDPEYKFPAFWVQRNDYTPDQDNGGNGELALQTMLIQGEGKKIYVNPAFPDSLSAYFKLHASGKTSVTAKIKNGKIAEINAFPPSRKSDIVDAKNLRLSR